MLERPNLSTIRRIREIGYLNHNLKRPYTVDRDPKTYEQDLPRFQGRTFYDYLKQRMDKGENPSLLDVGSGDGTMLDLLRRDFPRLKLHGLSAYDFRNGGYPAAAQLQVDSPAHNIDHRIGNAQTLASIFKGHSFDFIVSAYSFEYFPDALAALKQAFRLLNEGGLLFLDKFTRLSVQEAAMLSNYWQQFGIDFNLQRIEHNPVSEYRLALKKAKGPKLPLPFNYQGYDVQTRWEKSPEEFLHEVKLTYSLDKTKVSASPAEAVA